MKSKIRYQKPRIKEQKIKSFFFRDPFLNIMNDGILLASSVCCYDGSGGCSECSYPTAYWCSQQT